MKNNIKRRVYHINIGTIIPRWEFSPNPREEGLLKLLKYIKWENVPYEEYIKIRKNK